MFLRNCWYVAAFGHEVVDEPFARTLLGEPIVLYRTDDGRPVAFDDSCCHRALPLSMGKVVGANLQCGYHGLQFDPTGSCVLVPGQTQIPPGAAVRSFPVVERYNWIWIWMGDPALADPALLPDWHWVEDEGWRTVMGNGGTPLHVACNYELITDNLFDITHLSYVHSSTIGTDSILEFPCKTERLERSVCMTRIVYDRPAAPFYQWAGKFERNVDRWMITTIDMPCQTVNHAGCFDAGSELQHGNCEGGVQIKVLNAPTPETDTTTHYFYEHARNFGLEDPEVEDRFRAMYTEVFHEDKAVLEAQQAAHGRDSETPMIDINADAPCIQTRNLLRGLIKAEIAGAATSAAE